MLTLQLPTMTCQHCVKVVTQTVQAADPNAHIEIDLPTHRLQVETRVDRNTLALKLTEAGYEPA